MTNHSSRLKLCAFSAMATLSVLLLTGCSSPDSPSSSSSPMAANSSPAVSTPVAGAAAGESKPAQPSASPTKETAPALKTEKVAKGYLQISIPSEWNVTDGKLESWQVHGGIAATHEIRNATGSLMATLQTGGDRIDDLTPDFDAIQYTMIETAGSSIDADARFQFAAFGTTKDEAEMSLTSFTNGPDKTGRGLVSLVNYDNGTGTFSRAIKEGDKLPDVSAALKGIDRFEAYAKTDEYKQVKAMMRSLKQTKPFNSQPADADAGGACVGATFTYDLAGSSMTCEEAKSFVQKSLEYRPSTGAVEVPGYGICELPGPHTPGKCTSYSSGKSFTYISK